MSLLLLKKANEPGNKVSTFIAGGIIIVPDLHIEVDDLFEWVVVVEPRVGRLHGLQSALQSSALRVLNLNGH